MTLSNVSISDSIPVPIPEPVDEISYIPPVLVIEIPLPAVSPVTIPDNPDPSPMIVSTSTSFRISSLPRIRTSS